MPLDKVSEEQYKHIVNKRTPSAEEWNRRYPHPIEVTLILDDRSILQTKTRGLAWEVADGIAVICVEGKAGGYRLNRVLPRDSVSAALSSAS